VSLKPVAVVPVHEIKDENHIKSDMISCTAELYLSPLRNSPPHSVSLCVTKIATKSIIRMVLVDIDRLVGASVKGFFKKITFKDGVLSCLY
jgi:hypothetical protein